MEKTKELLLFMLENLEGIWEKASEIKEKLLNNKLDNEFIIQLILMLTPRIRAINKGIDKYKQNLKTAIIKDKENINNEQEKKELLQLENIISNI